jgi:hypothetical protein
VDAEKWIALLTLVANFAVSMLALWRAWKASSGIDQVHSLINSRMTQLLAVTKESATAKGYKQGQEDSPGGSSSSSGQFLAHTTSRRR